MARCAHFLALGVRSVRCGLFVILALAVYVGSMAEAGVVVLEWDATQEPTLAGYRIYWGSISRGTNTHPLQFAYENMNQTSPAETSTSIRGMFLNRTNYITITAFNTQDAESDFGDEIVYVALDADDDGIDDSWEVRHNLNLLAVGHASMDDDGDGMSNYAEYVAGTDPKDKKSKLACVARRVGALIEVSWQGVTGRKYTVEKMDSLANGGLFSVVGSTIAMQSGNMVFTHNAAIRKMSCTFRVCVE